MFSLGKGAFIAQWNLQFGPELGVPKFSIRNGRCNRTRPRAPSPVAGVSVRSALRSSGIGERLSDRAEISPDRGTQKGKSCSSNAANSMLVARRATEPKAAGTRSVVREREALGGDIAVEAGHSVNAGHVPGESETSIGLAYRITW